MGTPGDEEANRKSGIRVRRWPGALFRCSRFCGAGWLADRWLGTKPWLLVLGTVLGAIAGFYQFIRLTSKLN